MGQLAKPLGREAFLKRAVVKEVTLPNEDILCIRALPASFFISKDKDDMKSFETDNLLVLSLCDQDGKLLFEGDEKDLVMTVDHMSLKVLMDAIIDLNGLSTAAKGGMEAVEKN